MTDVRESIDIIEDARRRIEDALAEIKGAAREHLDETAMYRLERGVIAHIETSLSNDHGYLGGNMFTLEDTVNEIREAGMPPCEECGGTDFDRPEDRDYYECTECGRMQ